MADIHMVVLLAFWLTIAAFGLYVIQALVLVLKNLKDARKAASDALTTIALKQSGEERLLAPPDVKGTLEALSKLTDSLTKASPAVTSLIAAMFFLSIATIGASMETLASTAQSKLSPHQDASTHKAQGAQHPMPGTHPKTGRQTSVK